jgi:1,4-dihydroxy-2-naphthoate octaprenyltransferase
VVDLPIGVFFFSRLGFGIAPLVLAGGAEAAFFTPLMLRGLAEPVVFITFGPMTVVGTYFVLTGLFSWEAFIVSLTPGIFTMNVGLVSNTFDHDDDIPSGKLTLPVRLGQANAVLLMAGGTLLAYLSILAGDVGGLLPVWTLLVLLSVPLAVSVLRNVSLYKDLSRYTPAMGRAIGLSAISVVLPTAAYGFALFQS